MTRYPRQVDREYLSYRSGGLHKIQVIDGGILDLHQDLIASDRRHRNIGEHQLPTVFQHFDSFHAGLRESAPASTPTGSRVLACPVGELRERTAEFTFQASDVGAVPDALEPFQHECHLLAVLPDLLDGRLDER